MDASTVSSMLASPLPHSFLDTYSLSTSSLGCNALCMVISYYYYYYYSFRVFRSSIIYFRFNIIGPYGIILWGYKKTFSFSLGFSLSLWCADLFVCKLASLSLELFIQLFFFSCLFSSCFFFFFFFGFKLPLLLRAHLSLIFLVYC